MLLQYPPPKDNTEPNKAQKWSMKAKFVSSLEEKPLITSLQHRLISTYKKQKEEKYVSASSTSEKCLTWSDNLELNLKEFQCGLGGEKMVSSNWCSNPSSTGYEMETKAFKHEV